MCRAIGHMTCRIRMWHGPQPFTSLSWHRQIFVNGQEQFHTKHPLSWKFTHELCCMYAWAILCMTRPVWHGSSHMSHPLYDTPFSHVTSPSSIYIHLIALVHLHTSTIHLHTSHRTDGVFLMTCLIHMWHAPHPFTQMLWHTHMLSCSLFLICSIHMSQVCVCVTGVCVCHRCVCVSQVCVCVTCPSSISINLIAQTCS